MRYSTEAVLEDMTVFRERAGRLITESEDKSEEGEGGGVAAAAADGADSDKSDSSGDD